MVEIVIVFIVVGLPIICLTLIKLAKIMQGEQHSSRKDRKRRREAGEPDEAELIQQMYRSLTRLEDRIESLETIVISSESKKSSTSFQTHE